MRTQIKPILAAVAALVISFVPAAANAEREYFLVGPRHVFMIGTNKDAHLAERMEIEKSYADQVALDQDTFQKHVDAGADKVAESKELDSALDDLAIDRDRKLGAIFEMRDDIRDRHPELKIEGDGPYQVMGIELHYQGDYEVFDRCVVYAPWPGYVCVDGFYGGWVWGVWYTPGIFFNLYIGWHDTWWHGGHYWGGFYGHHGPVAFHPRGYVGGRVGGFGRSSGYVRSGTGYARSGWSGYSHSTAGYSHSATGYARSSAAGYSRSAGTGYTRSASGYTRSSTGYVHSGAGYSRSYSSFGRSEAVSRSGSTSGFGRSSSSGSGSFGRSSSEGRSSSSGGGYSRSVGGASSGRSSSGSRGGSSGGRGGHGR